MIIRGRLLHAPAYNTQLPKRLRTAASLTAGTLEEINIWSD